MCFLYRQSISIVYESKFKYIYRYFIKIDRCFCGILQSLPLRKCGLKFIGGRDARNGVSSLPLRKCGLKSNPSSFIAIGISVTSLAEVWIEISRAFPHSSTVCVTSLAEVWIEIWMPHLLLFSCMSLPMRKCGLKFAMKTR